MAQDEDAARMLRWQHDASTAERQFRAERARERLRAEGWSESAVEHERDGMIAAYQQSQDPWGAPDHMSDRKSKRKRSTVPSFVPWYMRGGLDLGPTPNGSGQGMVNASDGGGTGRDPQASRPEDTSCGGAGNGRAVPEETDR